jgi:DNA-binding SARP family transcriptional activator/predicted ATPase
MSDLQVFLLGPPEARYMGENVQISRRLSRALLFYLASHGGFIGRDHLLTLFWEEETEATARRNLRDTLSRLKSALPDPDLLNIDTSLVGLNFQRTSVDQLQFQDILERIGRTPWQIPAEQPLPEPTYKLLKSAVDLWRSPNFLAGANFPSTPAIDDWISHTSQRLEQQYGRLLQRLADHAYAMEDLGVALDLTNAALINDGLNDDLHLRLLQILVRMDRPGDARQHFERYRDILRRDIGVEPSSPLVDLYQQIRPTGSRTHADTRPVWHVRQSVQVPFIGRQETLDYLQQAFHKGGGVFIFGEAGQGKTRLLQEFTSRLGSQVRVLVTTCRQAESGLPFQPIIELLRYHVTREEWLAFPTVWASQLALLLPELLGLRRDLDRSFIEGATQMAPAQFRSTILEAIRQLFAQLFKRQRLLLCLDDAHWADEASIATLAYLFERQPFNSQAFLVTTARWEEYSPNLEAWMAMLQKSPALRVVSLSRFSEAEIKQLSQYVLGHIPSDEVVSSILSETGGNPFIILEALRSFLERGIQPGPEELAALPMVKSIQGLIDARMELLTTASRDVIEAAAVLGTDFSPEALSQVTEHPPLAVGNALEELEKRHLIELAHRTPDSLRYRFIHDIFREALLLKIHPVRERWLHARIAQVLETGPETRDKPALLAQHYEQAGETAMALGYWIQSGQRAHQLLSFHEADWAFSRAESLIDHSQSLDEEKILSLYSAWSETAYEANDHAKTQLVNSQLLRLGELNNSPLLVGSALDGLSTACMLSKEVEQGLTLVDQAINYLKRAAHPLKLTDAYIHRGMILTQTKRYSEAVASFQQAIESAAALDDVPALARRASARADQAHATLMSGWPRRAQEIAIQALEDYSTLNHLRGQITATYTLALARFHCGEATQALNDSRIGATLAQRLEIVLQAGLFHGLTATIEMALGNFDLAIENAQRCIDLGEQQNLDGLTAIGYHLFGELLIRLEHYPLATEFLRKASAAHTEPLLEAYPSLGLGYALWCSEQTPASRQVLEDALRSAEESQIYPGIIHARLTWLTAGAQAAGSQETQSNLADLYQQADERGMVLVKLRAGNLLGRQALVDGDVEGAMQITRAGIDIASQNNLAWLELQLRLLLDSASKARGQADPSSRGRILYLLARLESGLTCEPFKQAFLEYRNSLQAQLV